MSQDINENMPDEVIFQEQTELNINEEPSDTEGAFSPPNDEKPSAPSEQACEDENNGTASFSDEEDEVIANEDPMGESCDEEEALPISDGEYEQLPEQDTADEPTEEEAEPRSDAEDEELSEQDADGTAAEDEEFPFLSDEDGDGIYDDNAEDGLDVIFDASDSPSSQDGDAENVEDEGQPQDSEASKSAEATDPLICGYSRQQYEEAITELDEPPSDDLFINKNVNESQSTVIAVVKAVVYVAFIVSMAIMISYFSLSCANDVFAFVKDDEVIEVTIPEYATSADLSEILGDAGAIKHPWLFRLYARIKGIDEDDKYTFVPGDYTISSNMNYDEMFLAFVKTPSTEVIRITIPEGYTVDDIIDLFVSKGIGTKEGFVEAINNYEFEGYDFIDDIDMTGRYYRLEGYLYPDTYEFYMGKSEPYYIYKLLDRFDQIMNDELRAFAKERGITIDEALTIASIIEKEAYFKNDYDLVSSVLWNRLESPEYPKIECDTTLLYALIHLTGERVTTLTQDDLEMDNPYNSYKNDGLPPSPICNPSFTAITCALYPETTKYYFFVSDKEMNLHYAETLKEHQKNIEEIKKQEAE